jgi:hypothetical protein
MTLVSLPLLSQLVFANLILAQSSGWPMVLLGVSLGATATFYAGAGFSVLAAVLILNRSRYLKRVGDRLVSHTNLDSNRLRRGDT